MTTGPPAASCGLSRAVDAADNWSIAFFEGGEDDRGLRHFVDHHARELAANMAPHATLSDEDVSLDFAEYTNATDRVAMVVSAPLTTNEHWTAFAPGELKVFECGVSGSA